jgi:hypothetical protein
MTKAVWVEAMGELRVSLVKVKVFERVDKTKVVGFKAVVVEGLGMTDVLVVKEVAVEGYQEVFFWAARRISKSIFEIKGVNIVKQGALMLTYICAHFADDDFIVEIYRYMLQ